MEKLKLKSWVSLLESLSQVYQSPSRATILTCSPLPTIQINFSQANLKENIYHNLAVQYVKVNSRYERLNTTPIFENNISINSLSPSQNYRALVHNLSENGKKKNILEIYHNNILTRSLNLEAFHEGILSNAMVGEAFVWNEAENKIAYVAQLKNGTKSKYFDFSASGTLSEKQLSSAYEDHFYQSDYGEKLNNITKTSIFIFDHGKNTLEQVVLDYENIFPTHPIFADREGRSLFFCGYLPLNGVKLGILHCMNREAKIFHIPSPKLTLLYPSNISETPKNSDKTIAIPPEIPSKIPENAHTTPEKQSESSSIIAFSTIYKTSIRPFLSPDKKKLAFFGSPLKPAHVNCLSLLVIDLEKIGNFTELPQKVTQISIALSELEKIKMETEYKDFLTEATKNLRVIEKKIYRILQDNVKRQNAICLLNQVTPEFSKLLAKFTEIKDLILENKTTFSENPSEISEIKPTLLLSSHFSEANALLNKIKANLNQIPSNQNEISFSEEIIVPIIEENVFLRFTREEIQQKNDKSVFAGIFGFFDVIDTAGWMEDSRHIVISSVVGAELAVFVVDSVTKEISKLNPPTSLLTSNWRLLSRSVFSDSMVFSFEDAKNSILPKIAIVSNLRKAILNRNCALSEVFGDISGDIKEIYGESAGITQNKTEISSKSKDLLQLHWEFHRISSPFSEFSQKLEDLFKAKFVEKRITGGLAEGFLWKLEDYTPEEFTFFFPSLHLPSSSPLLLHLHGGPHGNFTGTSKLRLLLLLRGFQLLLPNFSGSCGYGQNHLESLLPPSSSLPPPPPLPPPPRIGRRDFDEVMEMVTGVVGKERKFWVCGGSYGGYLGAVLAGKEERVKGAILMNPVIDIPFMINMTDIPDWCSAETLGHLNPFNLTSENYATMYTASPSSLPPPSSSLLLLLGAKDRRVPPAAALAWANRINSQRAGERNLKEEEDKREEEENEKNAEIIKDERKGKVETVVYEGSDHALAENVGVEYDVMMRVGGFLEREIGK